MPGLGAVEIILIIVVIVLLFGARKLPDLARSVGRSMRIFKSEVTEMTNESKAREDSKPQAELTQGDDNDQFWQDPNMQPRQNPQQNAPQNGNPQQGYPQQQQNWGQNQGGYPQQGNPQANPQQQNWVDPQQGMQQP
ncbi:Sec-independent protein translocase subunit TatA, partial [Corynebacterium casei]|uniref:Sec-independent protein translocase subunit TatA n=1 Tax=Corynebacterium casei TaxID=160386 RepID=UPI002648BA2A